MIAPRLVRGFTLIEVVVALVIVALGLSALLAVLNQAATNIAAMRDRTVAEWIAMNQVTLARLSQNAPGAGKTEGDISNCGNGNWHWQQQVTPVDAVPGLMSITVSVRRTGNATPTASSRAAGSAGTANGPGATGALGPNVSLGPTQALGSVTTLSTTGCASAPSAGGSLGAVNPLGGAPGSLGASGSLGSPGAPGAGSTLGPGSLGGASSSNSPANPFQVGSGSSSSASSSNSSSGSTSSSSGIAWLVTLTGYRGNSIGAPVGESPDWTGMALAGAPVAPGNPGSSTTPTPTTPQTPGALGSAAGQ